MSDGKLGHEVQSKGVAEALDVEVIVKHVEPTGLQKKFAPFLPVARREKFGTADSAFHRPWPDLAIGTGRQTVPYMRALKRHAGLATFTVILLDPRFDYAAADLVWIPEHDQKSADNIISTLTPPHLHSPSSLALLRSTEPPFPVDPSKKNVVLLLGGPNGRYKFTDETIQRLITSLSSLVGLGGISLWVTASRRTPQSLADAVRTTVSQTGGYFWDGTGVNPIAYFYAHGDVFIATADSINMVAEPCVTGRPVYVFHPDGGAEKFNRFHRALETYGATRPMPERFEQLDHWSYAPLYAADTIAAEVLKRWTPYHAA